MKRRLHDKKAGIVLLSVMIVLSVCEVLFRTLLVPETALQLGDFGEPFATLVLAAVLLSFWLKGKDRVVYISLGAWLGYFVINQLYGLPAILVNCFLPQDGAGMALVMMIIRLISMLNILAIGVLLVEYLNDGTIYGRAFNGLCIATVLLLTVSVIGSVVTTARGIAPLEVALAGFNNLVRITMVFLFAFFAYDSAKNHVLQGK